MSGESRPSADILYSPRASTKGRVEARSHVEKNDRRDLAEEVVTQQQVAEHSYKTTAEQAAQHETMPTKSAITDRADRLQTQLKHKHSQAKKSAETALDKTGSFREGDTCPVTRTGLAELEFSNITD